MLARAGTTRDDLDLELARRLVGVLARAAAAAARRARRATTTRRGASTARTYQPRVTLARAVPVLPVPEGLERDGVALRRLRARDAGAVRRGVPRGPASSASLIGADEDPTENGVRRFIARQPGLRARGEFLGLAVTDATKRPFLGHVMLHTRRLAPQARRDRLLARARARAGAASARTAVSLLVDWAFEELELERIEITTTPDNAAARALADVARVQRGGRDDRPAIWSAGGAST